LVTRREGREPFARLAGFFVLLYFQWNTTKE